MAQDSSIKNQMAAVEGENPSMPYAIEPSDGVGEVFNADDNGVMSVGGSDSMAPSEISCPAMGAAEDGMVFGGAREFFNRQDDSSIEMGDSSQASSDVHEARPHRHEHSHGFGGHHHELPVDSGIIPNA